MNSSRASFFFFFAVNLNQNGSIEKYHERSGLSYSQLDQFYSCIRASPATVMEYYFNKGDNKNKLVDDNFSFGWGGGYGESC